MGGMSQCPGETGTTKVDSALTIFKVEYHCDPDTFAVTNECADLVSGTTATVGVIVQNMSPTRGAVTMRLMAATADSWHDGMYEFDYCGGAGRSQGLSIKIAGEKVRAPGYLLDDLAYGQNEVRLRVSESGDDPACHTYADVPISLVSDCEYARGSAFAPYQYGTILDTSGASASSSGLAIVHPAWSDGDRAFEADTLPAGVAGDATTFSVSWAFPATAMPTAEPTEPVHVCVEDDPEWYDNGHPDKDCSYIALDLARCDTKQSAEHVFARDACDATCYECTPEEYDDDEDPGRGSASYLILAAMSAVFLATAFAYVFRAHYHRRRAAAKKLAARKTVELPTLGADAEKPKPSPPTGAIATATENPITAMI